MRGAVLNREGSAGFIRDLILFDTVLGCMCIFPILQMRNVKLREAK